MVARKDGKMEQNNATKQANVKAGRGGIVPPVDKRFGQPNGNPRHNGSWKKEDTARYKLEQMLKLSEKELKQIAKDDEAPLFERKLAICIANGNWKEIEGMMNQVYGQPKQKIESVITAPKPLVDLTNRAKNGESVL